MNVPSGVITGNILATVLRTLRISLIGIVDYLSLIPVPYFGALLYWLISLEIINELSDEGIEEDPTLDRFVR